MKIKTPQFYDENVHWVRFAMQIILMVFIAIEQILHMKTNTNGISIAMFGSAGCYALINFAIALNSRKDYIKEATRQLIVYFVLMLMHLSICYFAIVDKSRWDNVDNLIIILVLIGIIVSYYIKCTKDISWDDDILKGLFALSFRILPQSFLAAKIIYVGGSGYSVALITAFHVMKIMRIYEIRHMVKKHHKVSFRQMVRSFSNIKRPVRSQFALFICETATEFTWILVTLAWIFTR